MYVPVSCYIVKMAILSSAEINNPKESKKQQRGKSGRGIVPNVEGGDKACQ